MLFNEPHPLLKMPGHIIALMILSRNKLVMWDLRAVVAEVGSAGRSQDGFDRVFVQGAGVLGGLKVAQVDAAGVAGARVVDALDVLWVDWLGLKGDAHRGVWGFVKAGVHGIYLIRITTPRDLKLLELTAENSNILQPLSLTLGIFSKC